MARHRHRSPDHAATLGRAAVAGLARRGTAGHALAVAAVTGPARPSFARLRAAWQAAATEARAAIRHLGRAAADPTGPGAIRAARTAAARLRHAFAATEAVEVRAEEIAAGIAALTYALDEPIAACAKCGAPRPRDAARCDGCRRTNGAA